MRVAGSRSAGPDVAGPPPPPGGFIVAVDVGGTFTDTVGLETASGVVREVKVATDPADPSGSVIEGLRGLAKGYGTGLEAFLGRVDRLVHGTTLGVNALLEGREVRVGLLTTAGFRDSLEFRRSYWRDQWDFRSPPPPLLVPRRRRIGIPERVDAQGRVLLPLDEEAVREAARFLAEENVEAVAVCFLFSFLHEEHERRAAEILREMLPGAFVTASCEVAPRVREYERTSTTVINAYVAPLIRRYLERLENRLAASGWAGELRLMAGSGGCVDLEEVRTSPVGLLLSGPAGGVCGAARLAGELELPAVLVGDMGGTSFDVCTVLGGVAPVRPEGEVAGLPVMIPLPAVESVGAGGGSIAGLGADGLLGVGPESAGALPGPASFDRGGDRATLTDALVVLGLLDEDRDEGSGLVLRDDLARAALATDVATGLGLEPLEAAEAVVRVAAAAAADAFRLEAARRGIDPRRTPLLAVGGALPPIAAFVARDVGARQVIVPDAAGAFCAWGMLFAEDRYDVTGAWPPGAACGPADFTAALESPLASVCAALERAGIPRGDAVAEVAVQARYPRQHHELDLPLGRMPLGDLLDGGQSHRGKGHAEDLAAALAPAFHARHRELYGYEQPEQTPEPVGVRLSVSLPAGGSGPSAVTAARGSALGEPDVSKTVVWPDRDPRPTPVVDAARVRLLTGGLAGPALVRLPHTTLAVPYGCRVESVAGGLRLHVGHEGPAARTRAREEVAHRG